MPEQNIFHDDSSNSDSDEELNRINKKRKCICSNDSVSSMEEDKSSEERIESGEGEDKMLYALMD